MWAMHMEAYLESLDVWDVVEDVDFQVSALLNDLTMV